MMPLNGANFLLCQRRKSLRTDLLSPNDHDGVFARTAGRREGLLRDHHHMFQ